MAWPQDIEPQHWKLLGLAGGGLAAMLAAGWRRLRWGDRLEARVGTVEAEVQGLREQHATQHRELMDYLHRLERRFDGHIDRG